MPAATAKPSSKPKPSTPTDKTLTEAELERIAKLKEYGRRGGLANKSTLPTDLKDEGQAFESIKEKWNYISHKLADEASKAARSAKKIDGRSLVALTTAAGIAYDKRWSKQVSDNTEIEIPASLQAALVKKLSKPLNDKESDCMIQAKSCNASDETTGRAVDPELLSPGL